MAPAPTNMRILRPSREERLAGDVFAYQMPDNHYRFGRLIARSTAIGGFEPGDPSQHLIYLYKGHVDRIDEVPDLSPKNLLLPPIATNQKPWTRGYFQRVARESLRSSDVLEKHCFYSAFRDKYYDLDGNELSDRIEPCGIWGLDSYRTIDDKLSQALGFDPVEDEPSC